MMVSHTALKSLVAKKDILDFANYVGVSKQMVYRWFKKDTDIDEEKIKAIEIFTGVSRKLFQPKIFILEPLKQWLIDIYDEWPEKKKQQLIKIAMDLNENKECHCHDDGGGIDDRTPVIPPLSTPENTLMQGLPRSRLKTEKQHTTQQSRLNRQTSKIII